MRLTTKDTKKTSRCLNRLNNSVFWTQISQMNADYRETIVHRGENLTLFPEPRTLNP